MRGVIGHSTPEGDSGHFALWASPSGLPAKCKGQNGTPAYGQKRIPSSNDGPCQLHACPGQRHMVFTAKKKKEKKLLQLLPPPSLMAVHLQPGWDAESGCLPGFSSPLSSQERGVGDPAVFAPAQRFPRGQLQQQTPEMKTTRPGHRCDTLVACDV